MPGASNTILPVHTNTIAQPAQIQSSAEERERVTLFGVTKQSWSKSKNRLWREFPAPWWDLNSIGGPRRTRDWAGKGTRGDQGGPSNMLNLRTIPLSKTEPNSGYKSRLISGGYNADCRKVPLHNCILNVKLNVNGQDCNMEI